MYTVGMDVDTIYVSYRDVNHEFELSCMLETSISYCPNKCKTCLSTILSRRQNKEIGKISLIKNNQQEMCKAQLANLKLTTQRKRHYSITPYHPKNNRSEITEDYLGYYLAGLIEGDGHFSKRLEIIFHEKDISQIQFLRTKIGFGSIYKIKDKKALKFSLGSKEGYQRIYELINWKLVSGSKIHQFNKNPYNLILSPSSLSVSFFNPWLSGFIDADGNLGIFIAPSKTHKLGKSCRLSIRITQKDIFILNSIKKGLNNDDILIRFDGLVHRLSMNNRYTILNHMIEYLDNFPFLSKKNLQYFYWRKAYLLMMNNEHLTSNGLSKIIELKTKMAKIYTDPQRLHA